MKSTLSFRAKGTQDRGQTEGQARQDGKKEALAWAATKALPISQIPNLVSHYLAALTEEKGVKASPPCGKR